MLEAAEFIPLDRLGTTDDCGFAPFGDDTSTARETAFAKIRARVLGTDLAAQRLGVAGGCYGQPSSSPHWSGLECTFAPKSRSVVERSVSADTAGAEGAAWVIERLRRAARRLQTDTYTLYLACQDPRTPWYAKLLAAAVVAYAFSPFDLIPDFVPVLGYLDDLVLVPLGIALAVKLVPAPVLAECRERARTATERPTSWVAAVVIVIIWLGVALLVGLWAVDQLNG